MKRTSSALLLSLLVLLAVPLSADYTTAVPIAKDILDDGRLHLIIVFTGNSGEKSQPFTLDLDGSNSDLDTAFRAQAIAIMNRLNGRKALETKIQVGEAIDLTPLATKPMPVTPCQTFMGDYVRLQRVQQAVDLGAIPADDKDVAALKSQVQGEYAASCLANF